MSNDDNKKEYTISIFGRKFQLTMTKSNISQHANAMNIYAIMLSVLILLYFTFHILIYEDMLILLAFLYLLLAYSDYLRKGKERKKKEKAQLEEFQNK